MCETELKIKEVCVRGNVIRNKKLTYPGLRLHTTDYKNMSGVL
jgi:hypothetical protein